MCSDTEATVLLKKGTMGQLPCEVEGERTVVGVSWNKTTASSVPQNLIYIELRGNSWHKDGEGYLNGSFDINSNFSLIILSVKIKDDGWYFCDIFDENSGKILTNSVNAMVYCKYFFNIKRSVKGIG